MPQNLLFPRITSILASAAQTVTVTIPKFVLPLADAYTFYLNSTTVTGTSPTLDVVFQTSIDGGTTYVNIPWRYAQQTAAAVNIMTVRCGLGIGEVGAETAVAATGGTLNKPCVFDPNFMKAVFTIAGTSPSFTVSLTSIALPRGSMSTGA